jgi:hypothetical protein
MWLFEALCVLPAPSLLGHDRIKLSDDVVANDRHIESTCDRIATLGTQAIAAA